MSEYVPDGELSNEDLEAWLGADEEESQGDSPVVGGTSDEPTDLGGARAPAANPEPTVDPVMEARARLAERTEDLQRLQAEYVNYKKRVDRDRLHARAGGVEAVVAELLPALDAIEAARAADELTGPFKQVADEVAKAATKFGLTAYGDAGDPFDPHVHDALMAVPGVEGQTEALCAQVLMRGYKIGGRIVRHARVAVSEPTS